MLDSLSTIDFEKFLDALDPNREQAAAKYIALRERLEKFFEWRNCEDIKELTDIVFDRITKKIIEGEKIENAHAYCVSIAKFVVMENRREIFRNSELDENSAEINSKTDAEALTEEKEIKDKRFKCLEICLAKFPEDKRKLLIKYFDTEEKTLIPTRRRLAEKMGININTLRIRISRLKTKLEKCTKECFRET